MLRLRIKFIAKVLIVILTIFISIDWAMGDSSWMCPICGKDGNTGKYCGNCAQASPVPEPINNNVPLLFNESVSSIKTQFDMMLQEAENWMLKTAPPSISEIPFMPNDWNNTMILAKKVKITLKQEKDEYVVKINKPDQFVLLDNMDECNVSFYSRNKYSENYLFKKVKDGTYRISANDIPKNTMSNKISFFFYNSVSIIDPWYDTLFFTYNTDKSRVSIEYHLRNSIGSEIKWTMHDNEMTIYLSKSYKNRNAIYGNLFKELSYYVNTGKIKGVVSYADRAEGKKTGTAEAIRTWDCSTCGKKSNTGNYCGNCASPASWLMENNEDDSKYRVGDVVCLGNYEQDNNKDNGTEPIEWIILQKKDGQLLLLSKYIIDNKPYVKSGNNVKWKNSYIRSWLNKDFIRSAFSKDEQKYIIKTKIDNSALQNETQREGEGGNGGPDTEDFVFLLSEREIMKYLESDFRSDSTEYVKPFNNSNTWMVRSNEDRNDPVVKIVDSRYGFIRGTENSNWGIRPAIWVEETVFGGI